MKKTKEIIKLANIIIDYIEEVNPGLKYSLYPRDLATYIVKNTLPDTVISTKGGVMKDRRRDRIKKCLMYLKVKKREHNNCCNEINWLYDFLAELNAIPTSKEVSKILERIKDIIAQPPDRISDITIEDYEKIRQAIFEAIDGFQAVNPKEEVGVEEIVGWLDDIDIDSAEDFYDRTKVLAKSLLTKYNIRRRG